MGITRYDGAGTTLTNAGETWDTAIRLKKIGGVKWSREMFDDTPLSEVDVAEMVAASIRKFEPIEGEYFADPDEPAPTSHVPGTWVITFNAKTSQTTGATITFTGVLTADDTGDSAQGERRVSKFTLTPDGKTGPTFADGT